VAERSRANWHHDHNPKRFRVASGRHINVGVDGTIEMSAEDAQCCIRDGWSKLTEWTIGETFRPEGHLYAQSRFVPHGVRFDAQANREFESSSLQRRVSSKLGSDTSAMEASAEPGTRPSTTPVALNQVPWRSKLARRSARILTTGEAHGGLCCRSSSPPLREFGLKR